MSALLERFEAGTLDPGAFTHADHVRVAYELLLQHTFLEAAARFGRGAQALATRAGMPEKFNATVTLAFMALIGECLAEDAHGGDPKAFLDANPQLLDTKVISAWYSPSRLRSEPARVTFLLPDRHPSAPLA